MTKPTETFLLADGYCKKKEPVPVLYRPCTFEEALKLSGTVLFKSIQPAKTYKRDGAFVRVDGETRNIKINGAVKTWKTRPFDLQIPVKYGLKEFGYFEMRDGIWVSESFPVVEVK